MAEQHEKALVPQIRFTGFTDPWEQRKLGDCGSAYGGLSGKTKEDFGRGTAKFVPYTNVFDNPITDSNRLESIEKDSKQNEVRYGDALFTVSSETPGEVGMSSVWLSDQPNVYLNSFCFGYRQDGSFDSRYLAYMLRSQNVRSDLTLLAQGISRFNISKNKVMELKVPYPGLKEQAQLGACFDRLDSLITLHQRKYDKLCVLKKSMLDKMFPKGGSLYPEIRFAGFTDPWEQRKLGELFVIGSSGGTPSATNASYYGGDIPFLGISDIKNRDITTTAKSITEKGLENSAAWIIPAGSICLAMYASVGKAGINRVSLATSQAFYNMVFEDETLRDFIYTRLEKADTDNEWNPLISTGTQANLNADKVKSFRILLPSSGERRLIAKYFADLDSLITLHQRKLELLRNIKKSMLDKMFV